jgi:hypothetical protein
VLTACALDAALCDPIHRWHPIQMSEYRTLS